MKKVLNSYLYKSSKEKLRDIEMAFFLRYERSWAENPDFLMNQWNLIKELFEVKLNLKDIDDCDPNNLMMAGLYMQDLENEYGAFLSDKFLETL